ncbi:MAG: glycerate kinase [Pseudomonadota bacterium]
MAMDPRAFLRSLFDEAVRTAQPAHSLSQHLPDALHGRTVVVGAGKASGAMAAALEEAWEAQGLGALEGLVIVPYDHGAPTRHIRVLEGAHPVPDEAGRAAANEILTLAASLCDDDQMIALVSGGGSSLLVSPAEGLTLDDKRAVNAALLKSGAAIDEMNVVRRHLSKLKGGRLAALAYPARTTTLLVSDVPNDDPAIIASGPTVADESTLADARAILAKYGIAPPQAVAAALDDPANETPRPDDARMSRATHTIIAAPQASLDAAAALAKAQGVTPMILGDSIEGEAREVGRVLAGIALQVRKHGQPLPAPCVLLSGGETTVTVRGDGRGGRNVECLLGIADALGGTSQIFALSADTDGVDGREPVAGAIVTPDTIARAGAAGVSLSRALATNDGHTFFAALGDQIVTGPTRTNVNDFRAILIL